MSHKICQIPLLLILLTLTAALAIGGFVSPVAAQKPTSVLGEECARVYENGIDKQANIRAALIRSGCGLEEAVPAAALTDMGPTNPTRMAGGPNDAPLNVNTITGTETYPKVTQSESMVWGNGSVIVVSYNDSSSAPGNYSGVSVSTDGGSTFTRLLPSPFANGHGTNYGDPIVVYNGRLNTWFAGDMATSCGRQGVGLWTSINGVTWTPGACAHNGNFDDRESLWVDNNPASPYFGRMYISWNDYAAGQRIYVTYSDNGNTWSAPVQLSTTFIRNVQLTGSTGTDGTVFVVGMDEGGSAMSNRTNIMYRSTNGGAAWTQVVMGSPFAPPGQAGCGYFARIAPIWRHMGWGQPGVGPSGVVHYAYAGRGVNPGDLGDIYYTRSIDNGSTWSTPIVLNTDQAMGGTREQWMPSLSVTAEGQVQVAWYDRRNTTDGQNYEYWGIQSPDNGESWLQDAPISNVLIAQPEQPDSSVQSCYAGDYNYHSAYEGTSYMTWTDGRNAISGHSQQDVYFAQVQQSGPTGGILQGRVTDASSGSPLVGARVRAIGAIERSALSGSDGGYLLRLPADSYTVTASAFGRLPLTMESVLITEEGTTIQNFLLVMAPSHRISGMVVSSLTGEPIANAEVRILDTPLPSARTTADGVYAFPTVPDGTYNIQASPPSSARCIGAQTQEVYFDADVVVDFWLDSRVDAFGYSCDDAIDFNWIPGDTLLPLIGDDASLPQALPFPFTFYGSVYSTIHVSTNGNGNFLAPNTAYVNQCLPSAGALRGMVAPLWDDLFVGSGRIWTKVDGEAPNRLFIIEWRDVTFYSAQGVATFEIILEEGTAAITFQYNRTDISGDGRGATVGIQDQAGAVGLQYSCNEPVLIVGRAIKFFLAR
ncbi:MAG: carboxypeptidase regulatory-like domain-containing protein [Acidobacteria bacterium]|nr:carboxypeptidase regulatory-like domain-containing protein [Acidobacteriota bacterium]MBI3656950.1 carboxypeptidase regulatory-like domain-containing protein [Acidobacteriota bacterium]